MLGIATFTIVSSRTSMSCAAAMMSNAAPSPRGAAAVRPATAGPVSLWTDIWPLPALPGVAGGVGGGPLLAEGGREPRRELGEDLLQGARGRVAEQPRHVQRGVRREPLAVHGGEVLPLLRHQRGVDQRQAVGLLMRQVGAQLADELVDDVREPVVAVAGSAGGHGVDGHGV